ncbi:MAG TPA: hypothetical protein VF914_21730 [Chloroflexia bacterium]|jgi:hypothetical protein
MSEELTGAQLKAIIDYQVALGAETLVFESYQAASPVEREVLAPKIGAAIDRVDRAQDVLEDVFPEGVLYEGYYEQA